MELLQWYHYQNYLLLSLFNVIEYSLWCITLLSYLVVIYFRFTELTPSEAELCLSVGVNPEFFLKTKRVLWADCKKSNGMVLKKARQMVKIDVNKTRKIFDYFMEQGILWPPGKQLWLYFSFWQNHGIHALTTKILAKWYCMDNWYDKHCIGCWWYDNKMLYEKHKLVLVIFNKQEHCIWKAE